MWANVQVKTKHIDKLLEGTIWRVKQSISNEESKLGTDGIEIVNFINPEIAFARMRRVALKYK